MQAPHSEAACFSGYMYCTPPQVPLPRLRRCRTGRSTRCSLLNFSEQTQPCSRRQHATVCSAVVRTQHIFTTVRLTGADKLAAALMQTSYPSAPQTMPHFSDVDHHARDQVIRKAARLACADHVRVPVSAACRRWWSCIGLCIAMQTSVQLILPSSTTLLPACSDLFCTYTSKRHHDITEATIAPISVCDSTGI